MFKLEIDGLKLKMKKLEEQQRYSEENIDKLSKLYDLGTIDENGELISNRMEYKSANHNWISLELILWVDLELFISQINAIIYVNLAMLIQTIIWIAFS